MTRWYLVFPACAVCALLFVAAFEHAGIVEPTVPLWRHAIAGAVGCAIGSLLGWLARRAQAARSGSKGA